MTRAWKISCAACSVRKGLIFLRMCSANVQDRSVFAMCSLKVSWSSKITPRFMIEVDGVTLPGGGVGDVLSSMPICLPVSLRSVQLPLDHLVEKRDRAVCHQCSNGRRIHVSDVVYVDKRRGPRTDPWGTPVTN